ncbi:hypothetical protein HOLleu_31852 [Holothuria leucospilota]|uniref:Uncharacterized protein n=1 Tax=Holothuria leucospilota TaxID=206669 RepID=A0A9Q0YTP7_HOLLE|nr:hypothetical protein HOLleu_31852 [Holothuria leucospilota]
MEVLSRRKYFQAVTEPSLVCESVTKIKRLVVNLSKSTVCQSPLASPILLVPEEDGTQRLCIDSKKLISVTVNDSHPIPTLDDCIDRIGNSKALWTCNLENLVVIYIYILKSFMENPMENLPPLTVTSCSLFSNYVLFATGIPLKGSSELLSSGVDEIMMTDAVSYYFLVIDVN